MHRSLTGTGSSSILAAATLTVLLLSCALMPPIPKCPRIHFAIASGLG